MLVEKLGFPYPKGYPLLMSGAGLCKTFSPARIASYARAADLAVIGSITVEPRGGNDGDREYFDPLFGLNAWGMPNPGLAAREDPGYDNVIASIAGFSKEEYWQLYEGLSDYSAGVELNFGCPNAGHPPLSYYPEGLADVLAGIDRPQQQEGRVLGVKLSPIVDSGMLKEIASIIGESPVDYVATCNTLPGGAARRNGKWAIDTAQTGRLGGISGRALNPFSLGQAIQFRAALPDRIDIIRVGGIATGQDVLDSRDVGCAGVQVVTHVAETSVKMFSNLRQEYADLIG